MAVDVLPEVEALMSDSDDELPVGWEMRTTEDGKVYYIDHNSKTTQWQHPKNNKRKYLSEKLPFGWTVCQDEEGRKIYMDQVGKRTTYVDPRLALSISDAKKGKIKFDSSSSAMEVLRGRDLSNKTAIVTGANSGIGFETAKALSLHGCHVVMACRDMNLANKAAESIRTAQTINTPLDVMRLDLSSLKSVRKFADEFKSRDWPLDILICNAAVFGLPYQKSEDGIEMHFAVNHLGHFYLTQLLTETLCKSAPARVVVVASESHRYPGFNTTSLDFAQLPIPKDNYWSILAYNQSKLCNVLFSNELNRRLFDRGVTCNAVHPGNLVYTNLTKNSTLSKLLFLLVRPFTKSKSQAAATTLYCAAAPEMEGNGGYYFSNCLAVEPCDQAKDPDAGKILWDLSERLVKMDGIRADEFIGKTY